MFIPTAMLTILSYSIISYILLCSPQVVSEIVPYLPLERAHIEEVSE
jgi:hypothetical protein